MSMGMATPNLNLSYSKGERKEAWVRGRSFYKSSPSQRQKIRKREGRLSKRVSVGTKVLAGKKHTSSCPSSVLSPSLSFCSAKCNFVRIYISRTALNGWTVNCQLNEVKMHPPAQGRLGRLENVNFKGPKIENLSRRLAGFGARKRRAGGGKNCLHK